MTMPDDRTPTGGLRDQIAEALHCPTCGVGPGTPCIRARDDNRQPHMTRVQAADAVLPVVEAATADAVRRRDQAENRAFLYREQVRMEHERAEQAEAAVRRVREMIAHEIRTGNGASAYTLRRILTALDAEQPKETPSEERAAPIDWEATVRRRERELKRVGEARHKAESTLRRVRMIAERVYEDLGPNHVGTPYVLRILRVLDGEPPEET